MALTQGRARRSSFELPYAAPNCLQDASTYAASSLDPSATLGLLLAATAQQHQQQQSGGYGQPHYQQQMSGYGQPHRHHQNGYPQHQNGGFGTQQQQQQQQPHPSAAASSMAGLDAAGMLPGSGSSSGGYDMDAEEPGPLPCLPRPGRALGSAGPYNSSAAALMMQQQGGGAGGSSGAPGRMRSARPRRHSVTIGMLNEHQQQQQAAAYAAAIAAAQQSSLGLAVGSGPAGQLPGLGPGGMLGAGPLGHTHMQQLQQPPPPQPSVPPSPAMQQLTALSHMQAVAAAAAAQLGVPGGAPPMLGGYPMHAPPEPPPSLQQLGAVVNAGSSGSPIMRFNGDLSALAELQQQPQLAGLGGGPRLPNAGGCRRHSWAPTGMNGSSAYALLLQQQLAALGGGDGRALLGLSNPAAAYGHHQPPNGLGQASGYGGDAGLLNGSGPASGAFAALSTVVANNMCGLQGGMLPGGYDALGEQQLAQRLLQLQQQASLAAAAAAGQRGESSYLLEALLDPGSQAGLGPSFTPPLQVNGVALDPQLLVSPFADNWDMISGPQGIAGLTPQQLGGGGVRSPTAGLPGAGMAKGAASLGLHGANGHAKALNGSCSSSSSSGSTHGGNGYVNGSSKLGSVAGLSGGAAAAGSSSNEPVSAEAALAAMVASLPPPPKVCSDAPWDLKKAAEEDAKVVAAQQQQVDKLLRALQRSKTLQRVEAASGAGAAAADGSQAADIGSDQQVLFGYKLPDAGADAWGGAAASAAVESAPGSGCISQDPSNKLFVGNIGWWVTEEDLLHWFSRFGAVVNVKIMYNSRKMHKPKDKWRSREYGFIDYATPEEAAKAIVWMDGVELPDLMKDTCGIIVQYAKPTSGGNGSGAQDGATSGISGEAAAAR